MKRRTGLLFSSAVVLGLAGGAVGGFLIQRSRQATPLPPIPQTQTLAVAAVPGAADPHDAKTDDGAKLDGDLRTLLAPTPAGAKESQAFTRDWFTIADLAEYYHNPQSALVKLNSYTFRRAARAGWTQTDGFDVEIDLVQFRSTDGASSYFTMTGFDESATALTVQGTATGYVGQYPGKDATGRYTAFGLVRHGDVVEQVFMTGKVRPPTTDEVMKVTTDQAGLL